MRSTPTPPSSRRRVQRVGATVEAFQAEMDEFFERLLAEQDPPGSPPWPRRCPSRPTLPASPRRSPKRTRRQSTRTSPVSRRPTARPRRRSSRPPTLSRLRAPTPARPARPRRRWLPGSISRRPRPRRRHSPASSTSSIPPERRPRRRPRPPTRASPPVWPTPTPAACRSPQRSARVTSRVVVVGLVSVASIATFKRGLTRSAGVSAVARRVRT